MRLWMPHLAVRRTWTVELRPQPCPSTRLPPVWADDRTRTWCDSPLGRAGSPGWACQDRCSAASSADLPVPRTRLPLAPPTPRLRRPGRPGTGPRTRRAPVAAGRCLHQLRRCHPRCRRRPRDTGRYPARTEQTAPSPLTFRARPSGADPRHALVPRGLSPAVGKSAGPSPRFAVCAARGPVRERANADGSPTRHAPGQRGSRSLAGAGTPPMASPHTGTFRRPPGTVVGRDGPHPGSESCPAGAGSRSGAARCPLPHHPRTNSRCAADGCGTCRPCFSHQHLRKRRPCRLRPTLRPVRGASAGGRQGSR